jgi:hypothetical protein
MTDEQKKLLTEYLGECWHSSSLIIHNDTSGQCKKCGTMLYIIGGANRTFTTRNDLMDLYQKAYEDGKWDEFFWFSASHCKPKREGLGCSETTAWLFCLDGKDYEKRCKMVSEFYGYTEE